MDALGRAASHELEAPVRRAGSPERQQSHRAMRRVWSLAADGAQVAAPLSRVGATGTRRAKPTSGLDAERHRRGRSACHPRAPKSAFELGPGQDLARADQQIRSSDSEQERRRARTATPREGEAPARGRTPMDR